MSNTILSRGGTIATITLEIPILTPREELTAWSQPADGAGAAAGVFFAGDEDEECTASVASTDEIDAVTALETKLLDALEQVIALKLSMLRTKAGQ